MIEPAIKYKNELSQAFAETYGQEKYKYYYNSYFEEETISTDDWQRRQFAVTYNNKVIGYIAYSIEREARIAHHFKAINFTDNILVFAKAMKEVIHDIFTKYRFIKLNWAVTCGNPAEKGYDRLCKKYGGRIVGTYRFDTMGWDGVIRDTKIYELMRSEYLENIK